MVRELDEAILRVYLCIAVVKKRRGAERVTQKIKNEDAINKIFLHEKTMERVL